MGLMYVMPVDESEVDRIHYPKTGGIVLKSYGLPLVFWAYLAAILVVLIAMTVAVQDPLVKLYQGEDALNRYLALIVTFTMILIPLSLLSAYFYELWLVKDGTKLTKVYRLFFLPLWKKSYELETADSFNVGHFMDSPNMARIHGGEEMRGFMNKGYFELFAKTKSGAEIFVDRSSRKIDLDKIKTLLSRF